MKRRFVLAIGLLLASSAYGQEAVTQKVTYNSLDQQLALVQEGQALIKGSDCITCHKIEMKLTGPAYNDVAKKYVAQAKSGAVPLLAQKIIKGGNRVWGFAMMKAHPEISQEDAEKMVIAILSLADDTVPADKKLKL